MKTIIRILLLTAICSAPSFAALTAIQQFIPTVYGTYPAALGTVWAQQSVTGITGTSGTAVALVANTTGMTVGDTILVAGSSVGSDNANQVITAISAGVSFSFATGTNGARTGTITAQDLGNQATTGWGIIMPVATWNFCLGPINGSEGHSQGMSFDLGAASGGHTDKYLKFPIPAGAASQGLIDVWMYWDVTAANGLSSGSGINNILYVEHVTGGAALIANYFDAALGNYRYGVNSFSNADSTVPMVKRQWVEYRSAWTGTGSNQQVIAMYRLPGAAFNSGGWHVIYSNLGTGIGAAGSTATLCLIGSSSGSAQYWIGRLGMPTVCSIGGTFTTDIYLQTPNQSDPLTPSNHPSQTFAEQNVYVGKGGSSSNDGATSGTAWDATTLYSASLRSGLLYPATPWQQTTAGVPNGTGVTYNAAFCTPTYTQGGRLLSGGLYQYEQGTIAPVGPIVNQLTASGADWTEDLAGGVQLGSGINPADGVVYQAQGWSPPPYHSPPLPTAFVNSLHQIGPASWTADGSGGYYTTDIGYISATVAPVMFENRMPLHYTSSLVTLDATPGDYYSNGTTRLYINPIDGTNPTSDGNRYDRTNCDASANFFTLNIMGEYNVVRGVYLAGCAAWNPSGATPAASFVMQLVSESAVNDFSVVDSCQSVLGGSHSFGHIESTGGVLLTSLWGYYNCTAGGCAADGTGGSTSYVDFDNDAGGTQSITAVYDSCRITHASAPPSSPAGTYATDKAVNAWISHGTVGGGFTGFYFLNCDFANSGGLNDLELGPLTFAGGSIGSIGYTGDTGVGPYTVSNAKIFNPASSSLRGTFVDDIIQTNSALTTSNKAPMSFTQCTIDYSGVGAAWLTPSGGANTVTLSGCILIPGSNPLATSVGSTDTVTGLNNEIQSSAGATFLNFASGGNKTLAQVQAGIQDASDTGSITLASIPVDPVSYIPSAQSSVLYGVHASYDFSGLLWSTRQTVGAYEFQPATGAGGAGGGTLGIPGLSPY